MTVRVKICGITNVRDAHRALDLGADALGFVFYPKSPRRVSPAMARKIISTLPPFVTTVGLFVNEHIDTVRNIRRESGIDLLQLHGDESPETVSALGPDVIKAIRVKDMASVTHLEVYAPVRALLLDAHSDAAYGGTGLRFDWQLAKFVEGPMILAGGLTPDNVAEAVRLTQPYGVDVSSGVESEPGRKDPAKLKTFIDNAKGAS